LLVFESEQASAIARRIAVQQRRGGASRWSTSPRARTAQRSRRAAATSSCLAAVAGVVVTGAGAAVTGAAAVAGERCLVAMFAPRPLLTASVKTTVRSFQIAAAPFRGTRRSTSACQRCWRAATGLNRLAAALASRALRKLTAVTKLLARS